MRVLSIVSQKTLKSSILYKHGYALTRDAGIAHRTSFAPFFRSRNFSQLVPDVIPSQARVVICGGGAVGTSLAYHLSERGCSDVVLLEQGSLGCGTSWHAAGLIGQLRSGSAESAISGYSRRMIKRLQEQEGHYLGWRECGSINLAKTSDRYTHLRRAHAVSVANGIDCHMVTPKEISDLCPLIRTDDLQGGLYLPGDGVASPTDLVNTYSKLAKKNGVKIIERCRITKVTTDQGRVTGVETDKGNITCEMFANCSGLWSREVGKVSNPPVAVPLHTCEHYLIVTKDIPAMPRNEDGLPTLPVIRDYEAKVYIRAWGGGIMAGGFENRAKPAFHKSIPDKFEFSLFPDDWDQFNELLVPMISRMSVLETTEVQNMVNGPESFTSDGKVIVGQAPEIENYFLATGMNSMGIAASGGVGHYLSEWMIHGAPSIDMFSIDPRRFHRQHNNKAYLRDGVSKAVGFHVQVPYPTSHKSATPSTRLSPLHTTLEEQGAVFKDVMLYACPVYFVQSPNDRELITTTQSYGKPSWFGQVEREYWTCKRDVALVDISSLTKLHIHSPTEEVTSFLQHVCSANIDVPVGHMVDTAMLNGHGGVESVGTVTRLESNKYLVTAPSVTQTHVTALLRRHLPRDSRTSITDVTSRYACIALHGPKAGQLVNDVIGVDEEGKSFPDMTAKNVDMGYVSDVLVQNTSTDAQISYVLYTDNETALYLYHTLRKAGETHSAGNSGTIALRAVQLEESIPVWGVDYGQLNTPMECGLDSLVDLEKGDFIGREALTNHQSKGLAQKLATFSVKEHDSTTEVWPLGREPVYRNGQYVGTTSSCAFNYSTNEIVCMASIRHVDPTTNVITPTQDFHAYLTDSGAKYEINIAGKLYPLVMSR